MPKKRSFDSLFEHIGEIELPEYSGVRVMMLPVILGNPDSLPEIVRAYKGAFAELCEKEQAKIHAGLTGYLTIDEKEVGPGETHRRAGLHVDGIYQGGAGSWGPAGGWGAPGAGMLTVSNPAGCMAWKGTFEGWPGYEGECDHLRDQCPEEEGTLFQANNVYWVDGLCVHESVPMTENTKRQFVRLSMPSDSPWFEGYTENPLGIKPTGPILPRRQFMD